MMQRRVYNWFLKRVLPYLRISTYYTGLPGWKYARGYALLEPGDVILSSDFRGLSAWLIHGDLDHGAVCVSKDGEYEIGEMVWCGYVRSTFFDACRHANRVVIMRLLNVYGETKEDEAEWLARRLAAVEKCKSLEGTAYDREFRLGIRQLYCTELVLACYGLMALDVMLDDLAGIGRPYLSAMGLRKAAGLYCVWDSEAEKQAV